MRRFRNAVALIPVAALATALSAAAVLPGPTPVTGPSPYGSSPACDTTTLAYPGAEVEPFVATDPTNPTRLIGVWQQDRFSNGGSRALGTAVSTDGGATWSVVTPPKFSRCAGGNVGNGGDLERATDPWVSIGKDGAGNSVAYQISDSFNDSNTLVLTSVFKYGVAWSSLSSHSALSALFTA